MNWNTRFAERTRHMRRSAVRELLKITARPGVISFAGGLPAPEGFPLAELRDASQAVLARLGPVAVQYGETEGVGELRDWIAARSSRDGLTVRRENILITHGAQQGLDLLGRVLLDPGDIVRVENPTYLAAVAAWRPLGVRFDPVPSDNDGMRVEHLEERPARMLYTMPNFQNPQGTTLPPARRARVAEWSRQHDVVVIEDDPYGELRYEGEAVPSIFELHARTGLEGRLDSRVVHVGTFSKVLAPGLRIGWVIAPEEVIDKLVLAKQAADLQTSTLNQWIALELVQRGVVEEQLPRLRALYRARRDAMLSALERHFPSDITWTRPVGGMFLLVTLPASMSASAVLPAALEQGVAFVPGEEFFVDGGGGNTLRLNFSNATPERIETGIERLGSVLRAHRSRP